jgi:hypothetical protein
MLASAFFQRVDAALKEFGAAGVFFEGIERRLQLVAYRQPDARSEPGRAEMK